MHETDLELPILLPLLSESEMTGMGLHAQMAIVLDNHILYSLTHFHTCLAISEYLTE